MRTVRAGSPQAFRPHPVRRPLPAVADRHRLQGLAQPGRRHIDVAGLVGAGRGETGLMPEAGLAVLLPRPAVEHRPGRPVLVAGIRGAGGRLPFESQYSRTATLPESPDSTRKPIFPPSGPRTGSLIMRGTARSSGRQLRTVRQLLTRIPVGKTTASRSPSIVLRPGTGSPPMTTPGSPGGGTARHLDSDTPQKGDRGPDGRSRPPPRPRAR